MNRSSDTTAAGNGGNFDPQQAAALLDQVTVQARRTVLARPATAVGLPGGLRPRRLRRLLVVGARPATPTPRARRLVALIFVLVAVNIGWSTWALKRAGAGVRGPAQRKRQAWIGVMLVAWVVAYAVTLPLYHAGAATRSGACIRPARR